MIKDSAYSLLDPCLPIVMQLSCSLIYHILPHYFLGYSYIIMFSQCSWLLSCEADLPDSSSCRCNIIDEILWLHVAQLSPSIVVDEVLFG